MDKQLGERLNKLNEQNELLQKAEGLYLKLEANKKVLLSQLTLSANGKSHAEKEAMAYSSQDWKDFVAGLVDSETKYLFEKRRFEILDKAFFAEHATYKREAEMIPKHGVIT